MTDEAGTSEIPAANHFAWMRTQLGLERTAMAWIRTSVSLTGFGFTIVKFFQEMASMESRNGHVLHPEAARDLGLLLIGAGIACSLLAIYQYVTISRHLHKTEFGTLAGRNAPYRFAPVLTISAVVGLVGCFALVSVFFRF